MFGTGAPTVHPDRNSCLKRMDPPSARPHNGVYNTSDHWSITLPPMLGAVLLAAGTALVFVVAFLKRTRKRENEPKVSEELRLMESGQH